MIATTYTYIPNRKILDRLLEIKRETGTPIARQIEYGIELFLKEYKSGKILQKPPYDRKYY